MSVVLVGLVLFSVRSTFGHWHNHHHTVEGLGVLSAKLMEVNEEYRSLCIKYNYKESKEIYGTDFYKIISSVPCVNKDKINVRIQYRLLHIEADNNEVRLLPDIVDPKRAEWDINNGKLEVKIPYRVIFNTEIKMTCDNDDGVIFVPRTVKKETKSVTLAVKMNSTTESQTDTPQIDIRNADKE